jgi:hypothetical protein
MLRGKLLVLLPASLLLLAACSGGYGSPGKPKRRGGGCGARAATRRVLRGAQPATSRPAGRAHSCPADRWLPAACGQPGVGDPVSLPQPRWPRRRRDRHRTRPTGNRPIRWAVGAGLGAWVQRAGRPLRAVPLRQRRLRASGRQMAGAAAGTGASGRRHRLSGLGTGWARLGWRGRRSGWPPATRCWTLPAPPSSCPASAPAGACCWPATPRAATRRCGPPNWPPPTPPSCRWPAWRRWPPAPTCPSWCGWPALGRPHLGADLLLDDSSSHLISYCQPVESFVHSLGASLLRDGRAES